MAHKKKHHRTEEKKEKIMKVDTKKSHKKPKIRLDVNVWKITAIALIVLVVASLTFIFIKKSVSSTGKVCMFDTVKLDFYVMSQCPYGTQVEDAIKPVLDKLGSCIDFNLNYIASVNADGSFRSLHGEPEVKGDIVQLCAAKHEPDKYMDMIVCQNENAASIPSNWESCAEENGLNTAKIKACYEGEEGKTLFKENIKLAQAVSATGSPTIYINNEKYSAGRDTLSFTRAICNKLQGHPECSSIPECAADSDCIKTGKIGKCENPGTTNAKCTFSEPVKVGLIVLIDERCTDCDTTRTMQTNKAYFPGVQETYVDYSTEDGKKIYEDYNITYLPAYIFDERLAETETWKTNTGIQTFFDKVNGKYILKSEAVGSIFDPTSEICDNSIDDDNDKKIDCKDSDCSGKMICREELKNNLQVFVMSDCPYGKKAIEALYEVVDNFGDKIDYEVHYIASESASGFSSLHGQYEVNEDIIQLCVLKHSPDSWLEYIYCRSKNGVKDMDWKGCAAETDVDIDAVQECFDGDEGKELLREDIKIAESLDIGASPTWLANNKYTFSGIDAETVKSNFCSYNQDLEGCENTLSSDSGVSGSC